jgi:hypothetical protein
MPKCRMASCWRGGPPCSLPQRPSGSTQLWSAVGPPEDGLRQDRPPELLLAGPFPRRPVAGLVVVKARALQPPPSPCKPPTRLGVPVGVTSSHLAAPSTTPAQRAAVLILRRVERRSNGVVAFRRPATWRVVPRLDAAAAARSADLPSSCVQRSGSLREAGSRPGSRTIR